ncbi:DUF1697 domain-containing protein [Streptomyces sp. H10-C2]|uniref:DUF1697 domain-containing protein n=1 Tax=unclassified Streptomyces TaxID=2593676 RepID=UPI0024BABDB0|nr:MULTISPECIES: DUF1697 domain-containing protein [unclassified Streptomyces]MDJ0344716.1 DUF1697 domain-containing protein [Streptomyces sp. PH10-H1]MDJ0372800.1 DUF1697 domain-containing protein [Streptomyces sp. H10-C2]
MTSYVALLRGINVGGKNKVPMQTLRELLAGLDCTDVRTHLQSGNAVFGHPRADPAELTTSLEARIKEELGLTIRCLVREGADIQRVVDRNPFAMDGIDTSRFLVTFLSGPPAPERLAGIDPAAYAPEEFRLADPKAPTEIYLHLPDGVHKSRLALLFTDKKLGVTATARNWNTVTKLAAMAAE